ncbi:hypothetical protein [Deinococcus sp.]
MNLEPLFLLGLLTASPALAGHSAFLTPAQLQQALWCTRTSC